MSPPQDESVTHWIEGLRRGEHEAARQLWDRYFQRIVRLAHRELGNSPRREVDEEDVALSVFRRLCDLTQHGGFDKMGDRDDLWRILITMTSNRVIDEKRRLTAGKRGSGEVRGESVFFSADDASRKLTWDAISGSDPSPELLAEFAEEHERLMNLLDGDLRRIAEWKLEQYDHEEIAQRLSITSRSVRRKLQRIRKIWIEGTVE